MIQRRKIRSRRSTKLVMLAAAGPLLQVGGCALTDLQQLFAGSVTRTLTNEVFLAAQTVFQNIFRL